MADSRKAYNNLLDVDVNNLDKEWQNQPKLVFEYMAKLADMSLEEDDKQAIIKVVIADLDAAMRENPEDYGISKVTEAAIKQAIAKNKDLRRAQAELRELVHERAILSAFVAALSHRKRGLENLVELHGMGYFSAPKAKPEAIAATKEGLKKRRKKDEDEDDE